MFEFMLCELGKSASVIVNSPIRTCYCVFSRDKALHFRHFCWSHSKRRGSRILHNPITVHVVPFTDSLSRRKIVVERSAGMAFVGDNDRAPMWMPLNTSETVICCMLPTGSVRIGPLALCQRIHASSDLLKMCSSRCIPTLSPGGIFFVCEF